MNNMRKIRIFLISITMGTIAFGQQESDTQRFVMGKLVRHYNAGEFDSIFTDFSPDMQKALPIAQTREFFRGLKQQAGSINNRSFVKYEQSFASYKTIFERGLFSVNVSIDAQSKINGLLVKPFKEGSSPAIERNETRLILPFRDEWTVVWGGDTKEQNYHVESEAQKNAFDLVITDEKGRSYKTDGKANEDYYAFGKELVAPCDAEVVLVVDGVKDNIPGVLNPVYVPGNTVILKTAKREYLFFAHFKQHSIAVKQGQKVKRGTLLGLCGNSGNSSEAHLHFHIQDVEDMNVATGVKCYFDEILVNGKLIGDYSPVQGEKIKNGK
jgi:murein DD-endopeptidase MepM/ murein hydrolase activator NlpD